METKTFLIEFEKSLLRGGLTAEGARQHTVRVAKRLTDRDRSEISKMRTEAEVTKLADRYLQNLRSASSSKRGAPTGEGDNVRQKAAVAVAAAEHSGDKDATKSREGRSFTPESENSTYTTSRLSESEPDISGATRKIDRATKNTFTKVQLTPEGKKRYRAALLKSSPKLGVLYLSIGIFSFTIYTLIALLITVLLSALVVSTVVGSVGTLAGLIYGVIKLFSVVPEGLYEIGFAIVIAGITLALCICLYNLSVRIAPILWKSFTEYLKRNIVWRLRLYFNRMRKEASKG